MEGEERIRTLGSRATQQSETEETESRGTQEEIKKNRQRKQMQREEQGGGLVSCAKCTNESNKSRAEIGGPQPPPNPKASEHARAEMDISSLPDSIALTTLGIHLGLAQDMSSVCLLQGVKGNETFPSSHNSGRDSPALATTIQKWKTKAVPKVLKKQDQKQQATRAQEQNQSTQQCARTPMIRWPSAVFREKR